MHVISRKRLREFRLEHPGAEAALRRWHKVVEKSRWRNVADMKATFPHADAVRAASGTIVFVFNVGGNNARLVARVFFEFGRVYVKRLMTHSEYGEDRWKKGL